MEIMGGKLLVCIRPKGKIYENETADVSLSKSNSNQTIARVLMEIAFHSACDFIKYIVTIKASIYFNLVHHVMVWPLTI